MSKSAWLCRLALGGLLFGLVGEPVVSGPQRASADAWPQRIVRIVTPFGPGISPDAAARTIADGLSKRWKQPVVVENRPGGDTMIGARAFLDMHDDHALLFTAQSTFTVVPLLHQNVPYDPAGDFAPISLTVEDFLGVAVTPSLGVKSVSEFAASARRQPGKLNFYAAPGAPYLTFLAFQKRAGIDTTFVPYNSPSSVISDLAESRIHVAIMPLSSVLGAAQAGKIHLIAVTNAERAPAAPEVPTATESGFPDLTFGGYLGLVGSKNMPAD